MQRAPSPRCVTNCCWPTKSLRVRLVHLRLLPKMPAGVLQVLDDMATMAYDKVVMGMGNEVREVYIASGLRLGRVPYPPSPCRLHVSRRLSYVGWTRVRLSICWWIACLVIASHRPSRLERLTPPAPTPPDCPITGGVVPRP